VAESICIMTDYHHLLEVEDARIKSGGNDTVPLAVTNRPRDLRPGCSIWEWLGRLEYVGWDYQIRMHYRRLTDQWAEPRGWKERCSGLLRGAVAGLVYYTT